MELRQYIYLSRLSGSVGDAGLRQIMRRSRENNSQRGLTGALLFDGESFVQLLEGPVEQVQAMVALIRADPRHVDFTPVFDMLGVATARSCLVWSNGYVDSQALDTYRAQLFDSSADPSRLLERFLALLAAADVN